MPMYGILLSRLGWCNQLVLGMCRIVGPSLAASLLAWSEAKVKKGKKKAKYKPPSPIYTPLPNISPLGQILET